MEAYKFAIDNAVRLNQRINNVTIGKKGEIKKMSNICKPDIGLITKISNAHIGNFNSLKDIALAKSEIFFGMNNNGTAILNQNDPYHFLLKKILSFGFIFKQKYKANKKAIIVI